MAEHIEVFRNSLGLKNWRCPECGHSNPVAEEECRTCPFEAPSECIEETD